VRVLVVEDVASLADDIAEGLRDQGFAVDVAYNGESVSVSDRSGRGDMTKPAQGSVPISA
jgi:DNA-binding response OmpR family regulator